MKRNPATQAQVEAADPRMSTWLSANAGSGKTRVLTDRVARLLLAGTSPQNILCLTYTKAAASEMQNRLFQRLGSWAMMPGDRLATQLAELGVDAALTTEYLADARRLFAAAVETPGGLKIQTIHSFCSSILRRFPLEAGLSPQFREIEDHEADLLRRAVLEEMAKGSDHSVVDSLFQHFTGAELGELLDEITSSASAFQTTSTEAILDALNLEAGANRDEAIGMAFSGEVRGVAQACAAGFADQSATYKTFATDLMALDYNAPKRSDLNVLYRHFLRGNQSRSGSFPQSNHTKAIAAAEPFAQDLFAWMDRVAEARDFELRVDLRDRSMALFEFATVFLRKYAHSKQDKGLLDFDDLIENTRALLTDPSVAQWVLFRLDGGVDHILVDEAQDTSPSQWHVIELLAQEFTSGAGARVDRNRTIFVVGDKKQSIYSFQGADPDRFHNMKGQFDEALQGSEHPLQDLELHYSFRSSQAVLNLVDRVFVGPHAEGVQDSLTHLAFHPEMPGRIDLWPVVEPEKEEERPWYDPVDKVARNHHTAILAERIAKSIHHLLDHETIPTRVDGQWCRRRVTPGDILILVRRRGQLFSEIIAACKSAGLEIAGADRMKLGQELAVRDILSVLRFLALPEDDLSLAEALKSPIFGWTEQDLYRLAQPRPAGQSLWEALRKSREAHPATLAVLDDLRSQSDFLRPFDLISRILIRHKGRRAMTARLGSEVSDGLDALLAQALAFERSSVPSLTGFLAWFDAEDIEIKRQMDTASDRIRVMTVHGAKGLEAPIVILPDTTKPKRDPRTNLFVDPGGGVIWKPRADDMPDCIRTLRDKAMIAGDREWRRLLYVAITRAESWLIVAAAGDTGKPGESWYSLVQEGMSHLGSSEVDTPVGPIQRLFHGDWDGLPLVRVHGRASLEDLPDRLLDSPLPKAPERSATLAPSDLGGAKALPGDSGVQEVEALAQGRIIHALLEHLPSVSPPSRPEVANSIVEKHPDRGLVPHAAEIVSQVVELINAPHLGAVLLDGLPEVEISANLSQLNGRRVHGAIDRLLVQNGRVLAVDFKSNRQVPERPDLVPEGLLRQMGAYHQALVQIYPDRKVQTAILWTETGELMALPDALVVDALSRATIP